MKRGSECNWIEWPTAHIYSEWHVKNCDKTLIRAEEIIKSGARLHRVDHVDPGPSPLFWDPAGSAQDQARWDNIRINFWAILFFSVRLISLDQSNLPLTQLISNIMHLIVTWLNILWDVSPAPAPGEGCAASLFKCSTMAEGHLTMRTHSHSAPAPSIEIGTGLIISMALCGVNITLWVVAVAQSRGIFFHQQSSILFCELYHTERLMSWDLKSYPELIIWRMETENS